MALTPESLRSSHGFQDRWMAQRVKPDGTPRRPTGLELLFVRAGRVPAEVPQFAEEVDVTARAIAEAIIHEVELYLKQRFTVPEGCRLYMEDDGSFYFLTPKIETAYPETLIMSLTPLVLGKLGRSEEDIASSMERLRSHIRWSRLSHGSYGIRGLGSEKWRVMVNSDPDEPDKYLVRFGVARLRTPDIKSRAKSFIKQERLTRLQRLVLTPENLRRRGLFDGYEDAYKHPNFRIFRIERGEPIFMQDLETVFADRSWKVVKLNDFPLARVGYRLDQVFPDSTFIAIPQGENDFIVLVIENPDTSERIPAITANVVWSKAKFEADRQKVAEILAQWLETEWTGILDPVKLAKEYFIAIGEHGPHQNKIHDIERYARDFRDVFDNWRKAHGLLPESLPQLPPSE